MITENPSNNSQSFSAFGQGLESADKFLAKSYQTEWIRIGILFLAGFLSFAYHLDVSFLEGTEGLYAQVTREIVANQEYFILKHQGEPYSNKPPFYFWMLSGWTQLFGESEITLRATGAIFSLGTMWLTYVFGRILFSSKVGFWAALFVASNHVFLWYGRRVLIDSTLTFFMTFAVLAMVLGNRKGSTSFWYFLACAGMTLASMVKGIHGFFLPLLLIIAYSILQKEFRIFTSIWFWLGIGTYFWTMNHLYFLFDPSFQWHFHWEAKLLEPFYQEILSFNRNTNNERNIKFFWYLGILWFDFFPWSILIPSSILFLLSKRPFRQYPGEHLIGLWFLGFLLIMCLSQFKREPYLMPLAPSLGLIIGYYLSSLTQDSSLPSWHKKLNIIAFSVLAGLFLIAFTVGAFLLNKKWHVPLDVFPLSYALIILSICGILIWATWKEIFSVMLTGIISIGLGFVLAIVQFLLPAIDRTSSPKFVVAQIRSLAAPLTHELYHYGIGHGDLLFYLNGPPSVPRIRTKEDLLALLEKKPLLIVTNKKNAKILKSRTNLVIATIEEFPQPRKRNILILSIHKAEQGT